VELPHLPILRLWWRLSRGLRPVEKRTFGRLRSVIQSIQADSRPAGAAKPGGPPNARRSRCAVARLKAQAAGAGVVRQAHGRIPAGGSVVTPSTSTILARPRCPATSRTAERETLSHSAIALITARLAAPAVGGLVTQASSVWPSHRSLDRLDEIPGQSWR
jgi:hypothetical protein